MPLMMVEEPCHPLEVRVVDAWMLPHDVAADRLSLFADNDVDSLLLKEYLCPASQGRNRVV